MGTRAFLPILSATIITYSSIATAEPLDSLIQIRPQQWRTSPPVESRLKPQSKHPDRLTIHYTSEKKDPSHSLQKKLSGLFNYSSKMLDPPVKKYLWGDVPYHLYIDLNGNAAEARDVKWQPDTNTNYNPDGHITIAVEGDLSDSLSDDQKGKLFALMRSLQLKWHIPDSNVGVHKDYAQTICPGPLVEAAVREYLKKPKLGTGKISTNQFSTSTPYCAPVQTILNRTPQCAMNKNFAEAADLCLAKLDAEIENYHNLLLKKNRREENKNEAGGSQVRIVTKNTHDLETANTSLQTLLANARSGKSETRTFIDNLIWPGAVSKKNVSELGVGYLLEPIPCYAENKIALEQRIAAWEKKIKELSSASEEIQKFENKNIQTIKGLEKHLIQKR